MHEPVPARAQAAARKSFEAGLAVHRELGPGLLKSAYEHCLAHELARSGVQIQRQAALPIVYGGETLDAGYRIDMIVDASVIIEIKSVEALAPIHEAQVLTYLKLSGLRVGLLMNFNVHLFKQGVRRFVL